MKRFLIIPLIAVLFAGVVTATPAPKVFVCKYVGTPGEDERLQTGQNPISVSSNAIKDYKGVGSYFNDAQGRSYVLAIDEGQDEPSVSQCPQPEQPPKEPPTEEKPPVDTPDKPDKDTDQPLNSRKIKPNPIVPLSQQEGK